jgi:hypothetical protein
MTNLLNLDAEHRAALLHDGDFQLVVAPSSTALLYTLASFTTEEVCEGEEITARSNEARTGSAMGARFRE